MISSHDWLPLHLLLSNLRVEKYNVFFFLFALWQEVFWAQIRLKRWRRCGQRSALPERAQSCPSAPLSNTISDASAWDTNTSLTAVSPEQISTMCSMGKQMIRVFELCVSVLELNQHVSNSWSIIEKTTNCKYLKSYLELRWRKSFHLRSKNPHVMFMKINTVLFNNTFFFIVCTCLYFTLRWMLDLW